MWFNDQTHSNSTDYLRSGEKWTPKATIQHMQLILNQNDRQQKHQPLRRCSALTLCPWWSLRPDLPVTPDVQTGPAVGCLRRCVCGQRLVRGFGWPLGQLLFLAVLTAGQLALESWSRSWLACRVVSMTLGVPSETAGESEMRHPYKRERERDMSLLFSCAFLPFYWCNSHRL